jgi:hypothetical protein
MRTIRSHSASEAAIYTLEASTERTISELDNAKGRSYGTAYSTRHSRPHAVKYAAGCSLV